MRGAHHVKHHAALRTKASIGENVGYSDYNVEPAINRRFSSYSDFRVEFDSPLADVASYPEQGSSDAGF
jgi:hypothetical protein